LTKQPETFYEQGDFAMSLSKIRFASMIAVVLLAFVAVCASISLVRSEAQEPAKPEGKARKIKEMQQERLATARELAKVQTARFRSNQGQIEEVLEATRVLADAELDLCVSDKERVAVLEKILAVAEDTERMAANFAKVGQGRDSTALVAKAERLRIEIDLERVKAKKALPQKGAANSDPDAKGIDAQPKNGDARRLSTLPATIQAFESVRLFAKVPGYLKKQTIDIGDRVKRGQVLAVLDVPDLEAQLQSESAALDRERSRVAQAKSRISGVEAELKAAMLAVTQAETNAKTAAAAARFREKQWTRMKELFDAKGIDERLLDEAKERYDAALEAERSAKTAIAIAKAHIVANESKIDQARTDIVAAEAEVKVAQAKLVKSQVLLDFATITAPFDGIVTQRGYLPGDFIQSAENGKKAEPLLTIERADLLRVIVSIPERDVPFVERGDAVEVTIDAFPDRKWSAKVSRVAGAVDRKTGGMRVEIDLPNPTGQIHSGMTGNARVSRSEKN
jgi:multidrug efflux pump subunit AcrA (membrane-fusion protein)